MKPAPLTPQPEWHHLRRLAPEFYRGFAVVQWTIALDRRATGWLDDRFHLHFRELLLHAAARSAIVAGYPFLHPLGEDFSGALLETLHGATGGKARVAASRQSAAI